MDSGGYRRILIVKLSSIGDVVHTLPALRALRRGFPEAEIDWVVEEPSAPILMAHPCLTNLYVFRKERLLKAPLGGGGIRAAIELIRTLRQRRYDLVIDFQGLLKSGIITFLTGGRMRMGFDRTRELSYLFLNRRLPPYDPDIHAVDRYMDIPRSLGCPDDVGFHIPVCEEERERITTILRREGVEDFVLISPWARWSSKLWREDRFSALCDAITSMGLGVVLVGGREAIPYVERIVEGVKGRVLNLTGRINLRELAHLAHLSRLLITTDSGPMHIASAMGTRVVALFGPTSPDRTGPYGEGHRVVRRDLDCAPCFRKRCRSMECMDSITVEEVVEAAMEIIGARAWNG